MSRLRSSWKSISALAFSLLAFPVAQAETLESLLPELLTQHETIIAAQADLEKSRQTWLQSKADWLPSLDMTLSQGYEKQLKASPPDTKEFRNVEELELNQLIYDFGETTSKVRSSRLKYAKSKVDLELKRQRLLLDAAKNYLGLMRSVESLQYSQRSEANIKKQTGMEEARVRRGSGLSTDVLQTKSSLAGAMATRVRSEGAVVTAANAYRGLFRIDPILDELEQPRVPYEKIPNTLDEAIDIAKRRSLDLKKAKLDVAIAREGIRTAGAKLAPSLDFKGTFKHKHNDAGTLGTKEEYLAKIDMTYPLFAGGKDLAGLRGARQSLISSEYTLLDREYDLEKRVRNAWQNLSTSRSNAQFLRNQANISGEFLDFARKERKLGTRSLLDVLNGETAYINALSSAVSAETDMAIAVFTLLEAMGELTADIFEMAVVPDAQVDDDSAVAPTVISPTAEAAGAAAAARRISARLAQPPEDSQPSEAQVATEEQPEAEPVAASTPVATEPETVAEVTTPPPAPPREIRAVGPMGGAPDTLSEKIGPRSESGAAETTSKVGPLAEPA